MDKTQLIQVIIDQLLIDLQILLNAARTAHEASTHAENIPDNKYDTLALEASYVAQGQANRASQIRRSIDSYRQLQSNQLKSSSVRLTSLVTVEDDDGATKNLFIGPTEGGLRFVHNGEEIVVITPASPMGRELMGRSAGDRFEVETGTTLMEYEIVEIS